MNTQSSAALAGSSLWSTRAWVERVPSVLLGLAGTGLVALVGLVLSLNAQAARQEVLMKEVLRRQERIEDRLEHQWGELLGRVEELERAAGLGQRRGR